MLIHLWNLLNLGQNLNQKLLMIIRVDVTWKSLKKKLTKSRYRDFKNIFIRHTKFEKPKKQSFQKDFWELGSFFILQKSITTIWLRIKISIAHLIILFHVKKHT
jgi:hypothetical protein